MEDFCELTCASMLHFEEEIKDSLRSAEEISDELRYTPSQLKAVNQRLQEWKRPTEAIPKRIERSVQQGTESIVSKM